MGVADRFLLDVANRQRLGADLTSAVLGIERSGSMEGRPAITVTVDDPRDRLMESRVLTRPAVRAEGSAASHALRPIDVLLDGVWYRLVQAKRQGGDAVGLVFDHRGVVYMTEHDSPLSASRNDRTRALFIRRQVDEVARRRGAGHRLAFWAWEVRRRMPIAAPTDEQSSRSEPDRDAADVSEEAKRAKGLVLKGRTVNAAQRKNIAKAVRAVEDTKAGPKAALALYMACIVEPSDPNQGVEGVPFGNPRGGHSTSVGILQLLDSHLGGSVSTDGGRRDVYLVCRLFLEKGFTGRGGAIELARKHPGASAGQIAQMVQGSAYPTRYDAVRRDAERVVEAFGGEDAEAGKGGTYVKPHRFRRPRGEDAWTNTGNLAEEVGRRRFVTLPARGVDLFVYAADRDLLRLRPQAVIDPDAGYVERFSYDLDYGKTVRAASIRVRGEDAFGHDFAWGLPVTLDTDGPAGGNWLVWDAREVDGSPWVDLELRQPQTPKLEPAAEVVQRNDSSDSDPDSDGSASGKVVARAKAISERNLPYVWGGGHAKAGRADGGTGRDPGTGFDCSGYVAACLLAGDMLPDAWKSGVPASGVFASSWGEAGEGERLTIWANADHMFAEVKIRGERVRWIDTSRAAGGGSGPHVRFGSRSTAGFTPRHWPGV